MTELNNPSDLALGGPDSEADAARLNLALRYRRNSIIFGVVGLFIFGVAFGLMAFVTARKAEAEGVKATAGKVLGVLGFLSGIVGLIIFYKYNN